MRVAIVFGSSCGTTESVAHRIARQCEPEFDVTVLDVRGCDLAALRFLAFLTFGPALLAAFLGHRSRCAALRKRKCAAALVGKFSGL